MVRTSLALGIGVANPVNCFSVQGLTGERQTVTFQASWSLAGEGPCGVSGATDRHEAGLWRRGVSGTEATRQIPAPAFVTGHRVLDTLREPGSPSTRSIVSALLLLLATPLSAQVNLPTRQVMDTRLIQSVEFEDHVLSHALQRYQQAAPNETAICLYGRVDGERVVATKSLNPVIDSADSVHVTFYCPKATDFLGTLHTHPGVREPDEACRPSTSDWNSALMWDEETVLLSVLCGNNTAYLQLRDERWITYGWSQDDKNMAQQLSDSRQDAQRSGRRRLGSGG